MNAAIRAKRILAHLSNYHSHDETDNWPEGLNGPHLGQPVGWYGLCGASDNLIGMFMEGIAWINKNNKYSVKYTDISDVVIPAGKASEFLIIKTTDGRKFNLPAMKKRDRFLDSMELLRFLDRVRKDKME